MNQEKLLIAMMFLAMFAIAFVFAEPFITISKVKEEFNTITKEKAEEQETIGKTNSNGLIAIFETKDGSSYRVSYARWTVPQLWDERPLIESIEKKEGDSFKEIHKK